MKPVNRVVLNTGILYAKMGITMFISLYATRLILAALGAEDYGIFSLVAGTIAMLTFLNVAMASATQRFMSYAEGEGNLKKLKNIFNVSVLLHLVIAIAVFFLLQVVGFFLFNGILNIPPERVTAAKFIFQFMLVSTVFTIISVPYDAVLNAHENMLLVAVLGVVESFLKLAIALYVTYTFFDKLEIYGLLMALLSVLLLIIRRIYCHRKYEEVSINFRKYLNKPLFKEMTNYAGWSLLGSTASIITMQGIALILNSFFGVLLNAAQGIAAQLSGQLMAFSNTMLKALNPVIVKSEGGSNREQMLKASMTGNKISFFLLAFFAVPAIIEMKYILNLWLKEVPDYAVLFCQLRLVAMYFGQLTITFPTAIGAIGNIKKISFINSLIWISLLPLSYILFKFGAPPETLYFIFILVYIANSASSVYFLKVLGGLSVKEFLFDVVSRSLGASFLTMLLSTIPLIFMQPGIIRLLLVITSNIIAFVIFLYYIGLNKIEKKLIYSTIDLVKTKIRGYNKVKNIFK